MITKKLFVYAAELKSDEIKRLIIQSPDTDVAVVCCYQKFYSLKNFNEIWFYTGLGKQKRFVPIHEISDKFGKEVCQILPAFHSLTGSDTTSSFSGIGKKSAFEILLQKRKNLTHLKTLGDEPVINYESQCVQEAIQFVCWLYDAKYLNGNINGLRYKMFCQKNVSGEKLPPTLECLKLHLARVTYQTYIWKNASIPLLNLPLPEKSGGWERQNNILVQKLMAKDPAPKKVVELIICRCKTGCKKNNCSCRKNGLNCTSACCCVECENISVAVDSLDDDKQIY